MMEEHKNIISGTISAMSFGGRGILRYEGKVFFISQAIPGEALEARIIRENKSWGEAEKTRTVERSPFYRKAPCPHFQSCGGCQWLDLDYKQQMVWKTEFIQSAFKKTTQHKLEDLSVYPSPQEYYYRNRSTFRIVKTKPHITLGFLKEKSHDTVPVSQCKIADPAINRFLSLIGSKTASIMKPKDLSLEVQTIIGEKVIVTIKHRHKALQRDISALMSLVSQIPIVKSVAVAGEKNLDDFIYDRQFDIDYWTSHNQFQQVNIPANHKLRQLVKDIVDRYQPQHILDLFCGSGNLSLHLCQKNRQIIGIESNPSSIRAAQKNVKENGLSGIKYLCLSSAEYLRNPASSSTEMILLDPPRQGVGHGIQDLIKLNAKTIVYISCDPNTLAKDCKALFDSGYHVEASWGMDFFPNTYHVESLVVLEKNKTSS